LSQCADYSLSTRYSPLKDNPPPYLYAQKTFLHSKLLKKCRCQIYALLAFIPLTDIPAFQTDDSHTFKDIPLTDIPPFKIVEGMPLEDPLFALKRHLKRQSSTISLRPKDIPPFKTVREMPLEDKNKLEEEPPTLSSKDIPPPDLYSQKSAVQSFHPAHYTLHTAHYTHTSQLGIKSMCIPKLFLRCELRASSKHSCGNPQFDGKETLIVKRAIAISK